MARLVGFDATSTAVEIPAVVPLPSATDDPNVRASM
jgi:hypothetical protein